MNRLYADKSTDQHYSLSQSRHIFAESHCKLVPEWQVYLMPDHCNKSRSIASLVSTSWSTVLPQTNHKNVQYAISIDDTCSTLCPTDWVQFLFIGGFRPVAGANENTVGSLSFFISFLPHCQKKSLGWKCSEQTTAPLPGFHNVVFVACFRRSRTTHLSRCLASVGNLKQLKIHCSSVTACHISKFWPMI